MTTRAVARMLAGALVVLALGLLPARGAGAQDAPDPAAPGDTTAARADTTGAAAPDTTAVTADAPPPAAQPLRTRSRRGGPYNVVADRLEGLRTPLEGEVIMLIGNVTLSRDGTTVTSRTGRYVKRDGTIYLSGGVHAVDDGVTIDAVDAAYNEVSDFLTLSGAVVVRDGALTLTSDYASYDQLAGRAEMWNRVRGVEKGRTLSAERVIYLRDDETAMARGRVVARDSTDRLTLTAGAVDWDRRREVARATLEPRLVQAGRDDEGPTTLTGDTITVETGPRIARASGRVTVERDSLRAEAGRAVFFDREQRGLLLEAPRAWTRETRVAGDTLEVFTNDRALERLVVRSGGRIDYRSDSGATPGETSVLTANRMEIFLQGDDIDSLLAQGEATNAYEGAFVPGRIAEQNHTQGERIRLYFAGRELERAVVTGEAKGSYRGEAPAGDSARAESERVTYEAVRITFEVPDSRIRLEERALLEYQNLSLQAPEVIFDSRRQVLEARGNPVLTDEGDTLRGRALAYDLEGRRGAIFGARTRYESGWYEGDRIRRLGDDVLDVRGAEYTTCSLDEPHYAFRSDRMKIYLKDKIIARPVVFALRRIPILALPFYVFPIRQDRHSGILTPQVQFGFNSDAGGFLRNLGYYWATSDHMDFTVSGDWYPQVPSWRLYGESRYKWLYRLEGQVEGSYSRREDIGGSRDWNLRGTHTQTIDDRTSLTAQANFTSSADYTRNPLTGEPLANRIDRFLTSTLTLNHRRSWASFNLFLSRRQDLDADPVSSPLPRLEEQLPALTVAFPTRTLGRRGGGSREAFLPFLATTYYSFNARFLNNRTVSSALRTIDSMSVVVDTTVARRAYQHRFTLSDTRRLFGFVNVGPTFRYDQVVYGEDVLGNDLAAGATWGTGATASLTLYGTSRGGIGPVTGVRHVFNPSVSWSYQPDFPSLRVRVPVTDSTFREVDRFTPFGGIGLSGARQSFLSINLANRFEAKVRSGEGEKTLTNLLTFNVGTAYDFLWERSGRSTPWQPIRTTVRIQPPAYVSADFSMAHDPVFEKALRSVSASAGLRFTGGGTPPATADIPLAGNEAQTLGQRDPLVPWSLSLSLSYGGGRSGDGPWSHRESGNLVASFRPTRNWSFNYYNQLDVTERRIVAQEWAVRRSLHCWEAEFVRRFSGGAADYYFRIGILNRPEIYLDRGTTGIGGTGGLGALGSIGGGGGLFGR